MPAPHGPERSPELGQHRASVAQSRLEHSGTVAIPDQRESEAAGAAGATKVALVQDLGLDAIDPSHTPGRHGNTGGELLLERAGRRELCGDRGNELLELGRIRRRGSPLSR
jgi:hypothetical protein